MEYIVETKGLTKRYGGREVVKDVDLKVPKAHVYGFMGPNGAGKSTTLKMLLGLIQVSAGEVTIGGEPVSRKNRIAILKDTGSLIESPSYYGHLTGRENLEIVRTLKKVPEYSLGMKQRLGLAEALLGHPSLLILDEPTNGLDPAGIQEIRELIRELPERMGMTVLVSSHLLGEMDQMVDYVGIIDRGHLIFQDKLEALHEHSKGSLRICVMNQTIALEILKREGISCTIQEGALELSRLEDDATARLIGLLSASGAGVYRAAEKQKSLEEIFLSLTGRRGSL